MAGTRKITRMATFTEKLESAKPHITVCGHRGGGGDQENVDLLTEGTDWSHLNGREPDHYEKRDFWANRRKTFEYMLEKGVRCFEYDLLLSQDGEVMIVHNSDINGKHVWNSTAEELMQAGCMKYEALLDIMEKFQNRTGEKITLLTELKGSHSSENSTDAGENGVHPKSAELARKTANIITQRVNSGNWGYEQISVIGFNHGMLKVIQEVNKYIPVGLSFATEHFNIKIAPGIDDGKLGGQYNNQILQIVDSFSKDGKKPYAINPDSRFVDEALIDEVHKRGMKVQVWSAFKIKENTGVMKISDTWITDCPIAAQAKIKTLSVDNDRKI